MIKLDDGIVRISYVVEEEIIIKFQIDRDIFVVQMVCNIVIGEYFLFFNIQVKY